MAQHSVPNEPLIVVLGSTGTGKSNLAVELALRYDGEVINADAMQLYRGLPIITNKISASEQRGVPHHLLGQIGLSEPTWYVGDFKRQATKVIKEIRSRGKLPIVVGGSHYYVNGLLFKDSLIEESHSGETIAQSDQVTTDQKHNGDHAILDGPVEAMHAKLKEVDPAMAEKWHPKDVRKIRRSLEIYLASGRRASEIYAEQERSRLAAKASGAESKHTRSPWQALLFWVYSSRDALIERLDARVHKMVQAGLVHESAEMLDFLDQKGAAGQAVDRTTGIWQSIGLKDFEPYLLAKRGGAASARELEKLQNAAVESVQAATRRYAKDQQRWITYKLLPALQEEEAVDHLYLLDSSDISAWRDVVVGKAVSVTNSYLAGEQRPQPAELSETARTVLGEALEASGKKATPCHKVCHVCIKTFVTEESWAVHMRSRTHQRVVKASARRALVVAPPRDVEAKLVA